MSRLKLRDIHSHFLYGLDDGAATEEEMYNMLDAAAREGICQLYATPHMTPGIVKFNDDLYRDHIQEARMYCKAKSLGIQIIKGAEILYTPAIETDARRRTLITMGETHYVLLEFSPDIAYRDMVKAICMLEDNGYSVIIAHAERYKCMWKIAAMEGILKVHGNVRVQINARTVIGEAPLISRMCVNHWLKHEMIDYIASDAHNTHSRPFLQKRAYEAIAKAYSPEYAGKLFLAQTE